MDRLVITRPDDWHLHLRDGPTLAAVLPATAAVFGRAIIMPNLRPPVVTVADALAYRDRILAARPEGSAFEPLMTLYLTDRTSPSEIRRAASEPAVAAAKLYPAGATTHSAAGVTNLRGIAPVLEAMAEVGLPLLVHAEVTDPTVDVFDREAVFIERHLAPLVEALPELRVVVEHATTADAVQFVLGASERVAGTVTPQHLLMDRNALFEGGLRPHRYCLPVLKRREHTEALRAAIRSGTPKLFLGTDSAPHARAAKESDCGCAGCYTAPFALPLYAEIFEAIGALDRLEAFASHHGPDFYGLPRNEGQVTLVREAQTVPERLPLGDQEIVPLRAGSELQWRASAN